MTWGAQIFRQTPYTLKSKYILGKKSLYKDISKSHKEIVYWIHCFKKAYTMDWTQKSRRPGDNAEGSTVFMGVLTARTGTYGFLIVICSEEK